MSSSDLLWSEPLSSMPASEFEQAVANEARNRPSDTSCRRVSFLMTVFLSTIHYTPAPHN
jgi:hypothetical protein